MPKGDRFFLHSFITGQDRAEVEKLLVNKLKAFPGGLESSCQAGDAGLIPGLGRSPEEGNGNPLQYSSLENPMDRGAWWATVHGITEIQT